jgi:hypothetical protein
MADTVFTTKKNIYGEDGIEEATINWSNSSTHQCKACLGAKTAKQEPLIVSDSLIRL